MRGNSPLELTSKLEPKTRHTVDAHEQSPRVYGERFRISSITFSGKRFRAIWGWIWSLNSDDWKEVRKSETFKRWVLGRFFAINRQERERKLRFRSERLPQSPSHNLFNPDFAKRAWQETAKNRNAIFEFKRCSRAFFEKLSFFKKLFIHH